MRILIVDDEPVARERLRRLLAGMPGVEVAGEAADGVEALERIAALKPDVVLLDIEMPGMRGTDVAASVAPGGPRVIFCTAYEKYAVDAFELNALDYLLKPVSRTRLEAALSKAPDPRGKLPPASRFLARVGDRYRVVAEEDVVAFVFEDGATKLVTRETHYWMDPTLSDLEARLDPAHFCRVSRAAVVRLDAVRDVEPESGGSGVVTLKDGRKIEVSRRRYRELLDKITH